MSINLKNFVNVNINYIESSTTLDFQTVVLFWKKVNPTATIEEGIFTSYKDAVDKVKDDVFDNYAKTFFDNEGKSLRVIEYTEESGGSTGANRIIELMNSKGIASNEIVICTNLGVTTTTTVEGVTTTSIAVDPDLANLLKESTLDTNFRYDGKDTKIVVSSIDYNQLSDNVVSYETVDHFAVKVGTLVTKTYTVDEQSVTVTVPNGSHMAVAAYLSNTNYNQAETYKDYMYTVEEVDDYTLNQIKYNLCKAKNFNCNDKVAGDKVNLGGNLTNGKDLVNDFALIVLQNVLTTTLYNLVIKKMKYNSTSLIVVRDAVSSVLDEFITNGYIATEEAWVDEDVVIDDLIIVAKGSRLQNGYVIYIADMTPELMEAHKMPNVYVVLNDSTGIRYINVIGKVR